MFSDFSLFCNDTTDRVPHTRTGRKDAKLAFLVFRDVKSHIIGHEVLNIISGTVTLKHKVGD